MSATDRQLNLEKVKARLELDRDRITGLNAAAELMRNHADDHEREALSVAGQRENLLRLLSSQAEASGQSIELDQLLCEFGLGPGGSGS